MPVLPGAEPFRHDGGPTGVLLVHGFTGTPQSMRGWGEHLGAHGLTVLCPRLPGHGTRWQDMNRTRWADWYGEVERGFDHLSGRCDQVFAFGLSMGGTLSLRLAEERANEVAGLVLVNPSVHTKRRDANLLPLLKYVLPSVKGIASDVKAPGVTELAYDRTPVRAAASLAELWRLVRVDLHRVKAPLLLFRSRVDHVVEPSNARLILDSVSSTDVEERVLEDSYHVATIDNDSGRIFDESLAFVRERAGVGG